jgi:hypothetical protein
VTSIKINNLLSQGTFSEKLASVFAEGARRSESPNLSVKLFVGNEFREITELLTECADVNAIDLFEVKQEDTSDETVKGSSGRK